MSVTMEAHIRHLQERLEKLEPPDGFTIQEWHIGQVYAYVIWPPEGQEDASRALRAAFEARFPEQTKKFATYMGWRLAAELVPDTSQG